MSEPFKPALIIVDLQEDFCPPVSPTPHPSCNYIHSLTHSLQIRMAPSPCKAAAPSPL